jgi:hypothetical protein
LIISPPTAPQPKPSSETSRPVRPNLRLSIAAAFAVLFAPADQNPRGRHVSIRVQAPSISTRRASALPVLVMPPRLMLAPHECSEGTKPR